MLPPRCESTNPDGEQESAALVTRVVPAPREAEGVFLHTAHDVDRSPETAVTAQCGLTDLLGHRRVSEYR